MFSQGLARPPSRLLALEVLTTFQEEPLLLVVYAQALPEGLEALSGLLQNGASHRIELLVGEGAVERTADERLRRASEAIVWMER